MTMAELALFGGGGLTGSLPLLMGDLPLRLTGDELRWTGSEGVDVKFLGDLDLSTAPVVRDSAATPQAADFGDSAAAPSCFLHGWTMPCGNLSEGSEVSFGDDAADFGSL